MSKSTKRRRVIEELNLLKHLAEGDYNNEIVQSNQSYECSNNSPSSPEFKKLDKNISFILNNTNNNQNLNTKDDFLEPINNCSNFESKSDSDENGSEEEYGNIYDQQKSETSKLVEWAIDHNVPNNTFSELLKILKKHTCFINFPIDARTLYQTHSNISYNLPVQVKTVPPGIYHHFGISNGIKKYIDKDFSGETIKLVIGVDGLPLAKSSGSCFWPILGYIRQKNQIVFPIGIYWGYEKPINSNIFIKDFVDEIKFLSLNGIDVEILNKDKKKIIITIFIRIDAFCCDSPAKSYLLKIKGHAGFYSCTR